jgi:hypothetical protein
VLGIVGIILNLLFLLVIVWLVYKIGWENFQDPDLMQQRVTEVFGK